MPVQWMKSEQYDEYRTLSFEVHSLEHTSQCTGEADSWRVPT